MKVYHRFEENNARSCCWERKIGDNVCGYWHIDPKEYEELVKKIENPIFHILNSALQALEIHKSFSVIV